MRAELPVRPDGYRNDSDHLVLARRDGNQRNTAIENLVPRITGGACRSHCALNE